MFVQTLGAGGRHQPQLAIGQQAAQDVGRGKLQAGRLLRPGRKKMPLPAAGRGGGGKFGQTEIGQADYQAALCFGGADEFCGAFQTAVMRFPGEYGGGSIHRLARKPLPRMVFRRP